MAVSRTLQTLAALSMAVLVVVAPAAGNGAGKPHVVPGILFPDCHFCPAPLPEPKQNGTLKGAPLNYTPGARYDMALEVVPYRGQVSRFSLAVNAGRLEAVEGSVRLVNFSQLPNASNLPHVRDFAMLTYLQPQVGPEASWRFRWTAPPAGTGKSTFSAMVMSGLEDGVMGKDAWRLLQVPIPEHAPGTTPPPEAPSPFESTTPRLEPAFLSPPPLPSTATPRPSPGFEVVTALGALALAALSGLRRRD